MEKYFVHTRFASGRMSLAKTVWKRFCGRYTQRSSSLRTFQCLLIFGFTDCFRTVNPPSKPRSIPPQPENSDSTFSGAVCGFVFFPPEIRIGFTASSGIIQTPLVFTAPGILPFLQYSWTQRTLTSHLAAISSTGIIATVTPFSCYILFVLTQKVKNYIHYLRGA